MAQATEQVFMKVPEVRKISKTLSTISETLTTVVKVLEVMITTLKTVAFMGAVGGYAVANFLEQIKPYIKQVAEKTAKLSQDLSFSVDAYERGDEAGATRFH